VQRDHIINEIRRLAKQRGGKAPGCEAFEKETGITTGTWLGKYWARWGDALSDAGFAPNDYQAKLDTEIVFAKLAGAIRHYKSFPTSAELKMYRRINPDFPSHGAFSGKADLIERLRSWLASKDGYADVIAMLSPPPEAEQVARSPSKAVEGFVYLIRSGQHYKIGRSDELERRVKEIRVALPDSAVLEHSIRTDDPAGIESYWHRRFEAKRANGEWFKLDRSDIAAFKRRKFQ
jgi:hypothetical protein